MTHDSETLSVEELAHAEREFEATGGCDDTIWGKIIAAARRSLSAGEIEKQTLNKFWHYLCELQSSLGTGAASVLFCYARDLGHKVGPSTERSGEEHWPDCDKCNGTGRLIPNQTAPLQAQPGGEKYNEGLIDHLLAFSKRDDIPSAARSLMESAALALVEKPKT
jgi:hypothetical protein